MSQNSGINLGRVAVLFGGTSGEREVSLMSGQGVLEALRARGVDAHAFDPATQALSDLKAQGFDRCFIALHGRGGEDGTLQGALEWLGIPYTGSGVAASSVAMDKTMTKKLWASEGIPTPRYRTFTSLEVQSLDESALAELVTNLGLPLIVKPPHEGSSIGVTKVKAFAELRAALNLAAQLDDHVLCEEFIAGDEVTCAVLGQGVTARALPVVRIAAPDGAYDYQNKYFTDSVQYHCPSGLPVAEEAALQNWVLKAFRALGCRGWGRADVMIRASNRQPFLLEMNTSPGMTSHSLVPMSAKAAGIDYPDLCMQVLSQAGLDRGPGQ